MSKELPDPTYRLLLTELTASLVGDGFLSPKTKVGGLDIGSPLLKSEKPKSIDPSIFPARSCRFGEFWDLFFKKI